MSNPGFDIAKLQILDIVITHATIDNQHDLSTLEDDQYNFDVTYGFSPALNIEQKRARLVFSCDIAAVDKQKTALGVNAKFIIAFFFAVENLDELVIHQQKVTEVDSDLLTSLANITYSTSRGIIYTRCQGTIIKRAILPVMPNAKLMEMLDASPAGASPEE